MKDFSRLFDIPHYALAEHKLSKAIGGKQNGKWEHYSSRELVDVINEVSLGLLALGVQKGDKIALISANNRPEWNIMDLGMQQIGAINVPVYPTISPREYEYIFNEAEVKFCFVSDEALVKKMTVARANIPTLREVYSFDEVAGCPNWLSVLRQSADLSEVERIKASIRPEELATIIYTSGTTGNPKGVMLSHNNIISNVKAVRHLIPLDKGDVAMSFLPLCHIFERTVTYAYMTNGITITYAESVDKFRDNIGEVRPHFFTTVPRLLEKAYERIVTAGIQSGGLKKSIFMWAIGLTDSYAYDQQGGFLQKIADKIVYSKIRERLGGNLKGIFTGAAACPAKIARVFSAAGIPVREGYGLTETSPAIALNCFVPFRAMLGTVGPVIDGVEVKIAEDGEILAKGPNIMMGYYKHPDKTAEVMSEGGWFHTGDIGTLVENSKGVKFLKITDRKKELLKTSGGKYVAPAPIEALCKESFYIEQMMILGEGQKFVSALIVPSFENLEIWAKEQDIAYSSRQDLCKNPKVIAFFEGIIKEFNPNFSHIEQIKKFELLADEWTIDSGELTPTMKLKRRVVSDKYKAIIEKIYA